MDAIRLLLSVFVCACAVNAQMVVVAPQKFLYDTCCWGTYGTTLWDYGLTANKEECAVLCDNKPGCISFLYNPRINKCHTNSAQYPGRTTTGCTAYELVSYGEVTTFEPLRPAPLPLTYCDGACTNAVNNYRLCDGLGAGLCHPKQGRIEFWNGAAWGTVCDDWWENTAPNRDANVNVTCSLFGYKNGGLARQMAFYGAGAGDIWLDDVQCDGTEASLDLCYHMGIGQHNCAHAEDVGVQCY